MTIEPCFIIEIVDHEGGSDLRRRSVWTLHHLSESTGGSTTEQEELATDAMHR